MAASGYVTRYSGGSVTPLSRTGFACLCLAKFLSEEFGTGRCHYYQNDLYPSTTTSKENQEIVDYFFANKIDIVKRSVRLDHYKKESIDLVRQGLANPTCYTNSLVNVGYSTTEELVKLAETNPNLYIKIKKCNNTCIVLDELLRGPIEYHLNDDDFVICGPEGKATPVMSSAVDDAELGVSIVVREWAEKARSAQEIYLHYLRKTCPPYYLHVDFSSSFKIEILDYIKNKLPPESLIECVVNSMIDRNKDINFCDFRFIHPFVDSLSENGMKVSMFRSIKDADKETRDKIIKAACPLATDQHINEASDVARRMAACNMSFDAIIDVCKAICYTNVKYDPAHAPTEVSPEFGNLEAIHMRILSHDTSSTLSLEQMIMNFSQKAAVHVEKIDSALEFCVIGRINKNKDRTWWWYDVAKVIGKEIIASRIKNAIEFIKKSY